MHQILHCVFNERLITSSMKMHRALQWRHNGRWRLKSCLLHHLSKCRSKKTSKLRVTGPCVRNLQVTSEFPAKMASSTENLSIWWRHHDTVYPMNDAHGLVVCCFCGYTISFYLIRMTYLPMSFRVASLAVGQLYNVPVKISWRNKTSQRETYAYILGSTVLKMHHIEIRIKIWKHTLR